MTSKHDPSTRWRCQATTKCNRRATMLDPSRQCVSCVRCFALKIVETTDGPAAFDARPYQLANMKIDHARLPAPGTTEAAGEQQQS